VKGPFLGIDTATAFLSLALWWPHEGRCVGASERVERDLARLLQPRLVAFLASHRVDLDRIVGVAVGAGPGSITGVRIGLTKHWVSHCRIICGQQMILW
jgi:tRNA threonylcarbamoyladenosine biosynthesis protein TsaB